MLETTQIVAAVSLIAAFLLFYPQIGPLLWAYICAGLVRRLSHRFSSFCNVQSERGTFHFNSFNNRSAKGAHDAQLVSNVKWWTNAEYDLKDAQVPKDWQEAPWYQFLDIRVSYPLEVLGADIRRRIVGLMHDKSRFFTTSNIFIIAVMVAAVSKNLTLTPKNVTLALIVIYFGARMWIQLRFTSYGSLRGRLLRSSCFYFSATLGHLTGALWSTMIVYIALCVACAMVWFLLGHAIWTEWRALVEWLPLLSQSAFKSLHTAPMVSEYLLPFASQVGWLFGKLLISLNHDVESAMTLLNDLWPNICILTGADEGRQSITCTSELSSFGHKLMTETFTHMQENVDERFDWSAIVQWSILLGLLNNIFSVGTFLVTLLSASWYMSQATYTVATLIAKIFKATDILTIIEDLIHEIAYIACKRAFFYGVYGYVLAACLKWPLPYTFGVLCFYLGLCPYISIEGIIWLMALFAPTTYIGWIVSVVNFVVWWSFLLAVNGEIQDQNSYAMCLATSAGIGLLGPIGILLGPLAVALPIRLNTIYQWHSKDEADTAQKIQLFVPKGTVALKTTLLLPENGQQSPAVERRVDDLIETTPTSAGVETDKSPTSNSPAFPVDVPN